MISDVQRCTYNTPIQQGETKLIAQMRKEEFIMVGFEGFEYYEEVSRFFGPKLMEVLEAGFDEDKMSFDSLAEETLKKLKYVKQLAEESDVVAYKLESELETCERFWEMYRIGVSILACLHEMEYEDGGLKNENIRDLSYYLLRFMTDSDVCTTMDRKSALEIFSSMDYVYQIREDLLGNK